MNSILEITSVLSCSLFTGAALYVNLVEHTARMQCGIKIALEQWKPSYKTGLKSQIFYLMTCFLACIFRYLLGGSICWLLSGSILFLAFPYTFMFIMPINKELFKYDSKSIDESKEVEFRVKYLLTKWNRLHTVRVILSLVSLISLLITLKQK
jgi:uncharacterized membrane protein